MTTRADSSPSASPSAFACRCNRCGTWSDTANIPAAMRPVCPVCLTAVPADAPPNTPLLPPRVSRLAIFSLALGILGFIPLALPVNLAALVIGLISRGEIRRNPALRGGGFALGGIICALLGAVLNLVILTLVGTLVYGLARSANALLLTHLH